MGSVLCSPPPPLHAPTRTRLSVSARTSPRRCSEIIPLLLATSGKGPARPVNAGSGRRADGSDPLPKIGFRLDDQTSDQPLVLVAAKLIAQQFERSFGARLEVNHEREIGYGDLVDADVGQREGVDVVTTLQVQGGMDAGGQVEIAAGEPVVSRLQDAVVPGEAVLPGKVSARDLDGELGARRDPPGDLARRTS